MVIRHTSSLQVYEDMPMDIGQFCVKVATVSGRWARWQGHVTTNPWTGLSFHDIRFKGERILFELSLNDQVPAWHFSLFIGIKQVPNMLNLKSMERTLFLCIVGL